MKNSDNANGMKVVVQVPSIFQAGTTQDNPGEAIAVPGERARERAHHTCRKGEVQGYKICVVSPECKGQNQTLHQGQRRYTDVPRIRLQIPF